MSNNIEIEDYRGWTIYFDKYQEKFYSVAQQEDTDKTTKTYSAAKKAIDDYIKDRTANNFKSFKVTRYNEHTYSLEEEIEVVGIRKDNRFIVKDQGGVVEQLSDYDLRYYVVPVKENQATFDAIKKLELQKESLRQQVIKLGQSLLPMVTLKEIKRKYVSGDKGE